MDSNVNIRCAEFMKIECGARLRHRAIVFHVYICCISKDVRAPNMGKRRSFISRIVGSTFWKNRLRGIVSFCIFVDGASANERGTDIVVIFVSRGNRTCSDAILDIFEVK